MIPWSLLPAVLGALLAGCAAGQVATAPPGASAASSDPHEASGEPRAAAPVGGGDAAGASGREIDEPSRATAPPGTGGRVDFAAQVRPILEGGCRPCHFPGGQVYGSLPFDRPATIRRLGTQLFTRIRDEEQRALIRAFLGQPPEEDASFTPPSAPPRGSSR